MNTKAKWKGMNGEFVGIGYSSGQWYNLGWQNVQKGITILAINDKIGICIAMPSITGANLKMHQGGRGGQLHEASRWIFNLIKHYIIMTAEFKVGGGLTECWVSLHSVWTTLSMFGLGACLQKIFKNLSSWGWIWT